MQLSSQQIKQFQKKILDWYAEHKRDLPWREVPFDISLQQRDPYKILVSETMLQQTQVSRVVPKYIAWIGAFPTVHDLAEGSVPEVLRLWSGLGYNRRALNLKKTAEIIVQDYDGKFPQDEHKLLKLPGIGQYTARALLCFAFNKQIAVVDTNVRKVILTLCHPGVATTTIGSHSQRDSIASSSSIKNSTSLQNDKLSDKDIQLVADQLLPQGMAYEWNQALMDYAGSVLKKEKIPIPKQSKFIGSHRYYRGQVLKILLEKKKVSLYELGGLIKKEYEEEWLLGLVSELKDEGFVVVEKENVLLAS